MYFHDYVDNKDVCPFIVFSSSDISNPKRQDCLSGVFVVSLNIYRNMLFKLFPKHKGAN